ncbi:MAG: translocation/assembly module TamB domain-containing protein [Glaciecola sp.]
MKQMNITKAVAYGFLGTVLVLLVLVMLSISSIGISMLGNWANKQSGISISNIEGSLYSEVKLGELGIVNESMRIKANELTLALDLGCLFEFELCVDKLSADIFSFTIVNQQESEPRPANTEYIELPLKVSLNELALQQFYLFQGENATAPLLEIKTLKLNASMHKQALVKRLSIEKLLFNSAVEEHASAAANTASNIAPSNAEHWLTALHNWQYQSIELPNVFVPINADIKQLSIEQLCASEMCFDSTLLNASIKNQVLDATLATQPPVENIQLLELDANIDLQNKFTHSLELRASPADNSQTMQLALQGNASDTQMDIKQGDEALVSLAARVDISNNKLPVNVTMQVKRLVPLMTLISSSENMPISQLALTIAGNAERYDIGLDAELNQAKTVLNYSSINLQGAVSLIEKSVSISDLRTSGELGEFSLRTYNNLQGTAQDPVLVHSAKVDFTDFTASPLLAGTAQASLSNKVNGIIRTDARYTKKALSAEVLCSDIQGTIASLPFSVACDLAMLPGGVISIAELAIVQGNNRILGEGELVLANPLDANDIANSAAELLNNKQTKTQFALNIDVKSLDDYAQHLPTLDRLAGSVQGEVTVSGEVFTPRISASLMAKEISFNDVSFNSASVDIDTTINKEFPLVATVELLGLAQQNLLANKALISINGNAAKHIILANLQHPEYSFSHNWSGGFEAKGNDRFNHWNGTWNEGQWRLPFDTFTLAKRSAISVQDPNVELEAHCWQGMAKTDHQLCFDTLTYQNNEAQVAAHIEYDLAIPLLQMYPDVVKAGTVLPLNSDLSLRYSDSEGLNADAFNVLTQSTLVTSKHNIALSAVVANMVVDNQQVTTNVFAGSENTGALGLRSELNLDPNDRTHKGQLRINEIDLSPLLRFVPGAEKLAGIVNGNLTFAGLLNQPDVNGDMTVSNGELLIDNYPYPFSNFNQNIQIVNNQANISGEFELGAGDAEYEAVALFNEALLIEGRIYGSGMQIAYQDSELLASPNINFAITPDKVSINGEIGIPNAQINIKQLPKSAKTASSDTIVIGKPQPEPAVPIGIDVDLRLLIDAPKLGRVNVDALDLEATLQGDLQLRVVQRSINDKEASNRYAPMETYLNGNIKVVSGSYEAYGQMLQIRSGDIHFNGLPSLPQFDIVAIRNPLNTADQVIAGVRISGNPIVPKVELFSEPAMIQARQLSYLLQGADIDGGESTATNVQLINALVNYGIGSSENRINKLGKNLGFDSLNVQTAGQGTSTQVQVTGRVSENIQITYGVGLFDSASEAVLKYQLLPQLYLEVKSGANTAVDLFYEMTRGGDDK